jgi:hypothetical protein
MVATRVHSGEVCDVPRFPGRLRPRSLQVPAEEHQQAVREREKVMAELEAAKSRITELEAEVAKLRETDEAYWGAALELRKREQWSEVLLKISELLERWPRSQYAAQAHRLTGEATEAMARRLYEKARSEMKSERFEDARSTLLQVRDKYPGTSAYSEAVAVLRSIDKEIEQARRRAIGSGKWRVSSEVSPIDDSTNVYVSLLADNTVSGQFGDEVRPMLLVRCKEKGTEVFVRWELYLGIDTTQVLHRLDDRAAQTKKWGVSTDHTAPSIVATMLRLHASS